jgi:hypothetical protein
MGGIRLPERDDPRRRSEAITPQHQVKTRLYQQANCHVQNSFHCVIPAWRAGIQVDMDVSGGILATWTLRHPGRFKIQEPAPDPSGVQRSLRCNSERGTRNQRSESAGMTKLCIFIFCRRAALMNTLSFGVVRSCEVKLAEIYVCPPVGILPLPNRSRPPNASGRNPFTVWLHAAIAAAA